MIRVASVLPWLLPLGACLAVTPAFAQGGSAPPPTTVWGLGIAVMPEVRPYRGVDDRVRVLPAVAFENRWVRVFGPGLELKLLPPGPVSAGLTVAYARDGYDPGDSAFLAGMDSRRSSVWLGGRVGLRTELANLSAAWAGDASGHSQGQKFTLGVDRRFQQGSVGITPRLTATWHDRKFTQYYYGVETREARLGRPAYRPGSSVDTEAAVRFDVFFTRNHTAFADVGVKALGSAARDSPLVDRSTVPQLRLGYLYFF
jgi:outer membrane protein